MKFAVTFAAIMWSLVALKAINEKSASTDMARSVVAVQTPGQNSLVSEKEAGAASFAFDAKHGYRREWFPR